MKKGNDFLGKLFGLFVILCIVLFTHSVVEIMNRHNKEEITKLEELNHKSEMRELHARNQRDSALSALADLSFEIVKIKVVVEQQTTTIGSFETRHFNHFKQLKSNNNAKDNDGTTNTDDDKYDFVSKYEYQPY